MKRLQAEFLPRAERGGGGEVHWGGDGIAFLCAKKPLVRLEKCSIWGKEQKKEAMKRTAFPYTTVKRKEILCQGKRSYHLENDKRERKKHPVGENAFNQEKKSKELRAGDGGWGGGGGGESKTRKTDIFPSRGRNTEKN